MPDTFQILADPTRRRIVEALRGGERSVNELVDAVDIGQPGVSKQLSILTDANFVVMRPEGRRRLYALRPEPFWELNEWMGAYRRVWEGRMDRMAAELERRRRDRTRNTRNKEKDR